MWGHKSVTNRGAATVILLIFIMSLIAQSIPAVNADYYEALTNGNFETGDLTGWYTYNVTSTSYFNITTSASMVYSGSYGCRNLPDGSGFYHSATIFQNFSTPIEGSRIVLYFYYRYGGWYAPTATGGYQYEFVTMYSDSTNDTEHLTSRSSWQMQWIFVDVTKNVSGIAIVYTEPDDIPNANAIAIDDFSMLVFYGLEVTHAEVDDDNVFSSTPLTFQANVMLNRSTSFSNVRAFVELSGIQKVNTSSFVAGACTFAAFDSESVDGVYDYNVYAMKDGVLMSCMNQTVTVTVDNYFRVDDAWVDHAFPYPSTPIMFGANVTFQGGTNMTGIIAYVELDGVLKASSLSPIYGTGVFVFPAFNAESYTGVFNYNVYAVKDAVLVTSVNQTVVVTVSGSGSLHNIILMDEDLLTIFNVTSTPVTVTVYYTESMYATIINQNNFTVIGEPLLIAEVDSTYTRSFKPKSTDIVSYFYLASSGTLTTFTFAITDFTQHYGPNAIIRVNITQCELSSGWIGADYKFVTALKGGKYYTITLYDTDPPNNIFSAGGVYANPSSTTISIIAGDITPTMPPLAGETISWSTAYVGNDARVTYLDTEDTTSSVTILIYLFNGTSRTWGVILNQTWAISSVTASVASNASLPHYATISYTTSGFGTRQGVKSIDRQQGGLSYAPTIPSTILGLDAYVPFVGNWLSVFSLFIIGSVLCVTTSAKSKVGIGLAIFLGAFFFMSGWLQGLSWTVVVALLLLVGLALLQESDTKP